MLIHDGTLADEPRVSALMSSRGYREVSRFELRRVDFAGEPPPPRDVEGITVRGFRPEQARGLRGADLHVDADSLTGATGLYAKVGMTAHPRFATWEKELRPGGA